MNSATPKILTPAELRALSRRSDRQGALRLAVHLALIGVGLWLVTITRPWALVPAMLLLGIAQAALFAPIHETMHNTAFATRRANAVIGWLAACPSLLNRHFYTEFHLAHHRFTQNPERDPELFAAKPDTAFGYTARVCALPYWGTRLRVLYDGWRGDLRAYPYISARAAPGVIASLRLMSLFMAVCAGLSMLLIGWRAPLIYWLIPQLLGQPFLRLYLLTEHTLCSMDANGLTNTRTTLTHAAMRLLMWNMSYHAEHHLYPSIPFHRLPAAHRRLGDRLGVVQRGYLAWHVGFLRDLRKKQASVRVSG